MFGGNKWLLLLLYFLIFDIFLFSFPFMKIMWIIFSKRERWKKYILERTSFYPHRMQHSFAHTRKRECWRLKSHERSSNRTPSYYTEENWDSYVPYVFAKAYWMWNHRLERAPNSPCSKQSYFKYSTLL